MAEQGEGGGEQSACENDVNRGLSFNNILIQYRTNANLQRTGHPSPVVPSKRQWRPDLLRSVATRGAAQQFHFSFNLG